MTELSIAVKMNLRIIQMNSKLTADIPVDNAETKMTKNSCSQQKASEI